MSPGRPRGARLALWWVAAYTATAPPEDAADRRAEVAADVADELRASRTAVGLSRRMAGRVLRGVGADLLWRLSVERAPGRGAWHLRHPATVVGALAVLLLPLVVLGDLLRLLSSGDAGRLLDLVHTAVVLVSAAVLAIAATALVRRVVEPRPQQEVLPPRGALRAVRRWAGLAVCVCGAAAALWRFTPGPWEQTAAVSWAAFAVASLVWLVTTTLGWILGRRSRVRAH